MSVLKEPRLGVTALYRSPIQGGLNLGKNYTRLDIKTSNRNSCHLNFLKSRVCAFDQ